MAKDKKQSDDLDLTPEDIKATDEALDGMAGRRYTPDELARLRIMADTQDDRIRERSAKKLDLLKARARDPEVVRASIKKIAAKRKAAKQAQKKERPE